MADDITDHQLVARVAAKDRCAMETLYRRHFDGLTAFVLSRCGDRAIAADVMQETMMAVWRKADGFAGKSSVKTWIYAIARFKTVDRLRAAGRLRPGGDIPETADDAPGPEAAAIASGDARKLRDCLSRLDEKRRSVIRLAFYEDLSYDDISEIEGTPPGTVKSRIFHAKRLLMLCLGGA